MTPGKKMIAVTGLALMFGTMMLPTDGDARGNGFGNGGRQQNGLSTIVAKLPMQDLSSLEKSGLIKMCEEEKLARDVYQTLYNKWGHQVFSSISRSEQRHMNAIQALLKKYTLKDPVVNNAAGVFSDPELQKLYHVFVAQGEQSLVAALQVGATIEDLDINDLYDFLEQTDNSDIKTIYQNLVKGSRNHLRAFTYQLSLNGQSYKAQYLTTAQINDIVSSQHERGQVNENGNQIAGNRNFAGKGYRRGKMQGRNMF